MTDILAAYASVAREHPDTVDVAVQLDTVTLPVQGPGLAAVDPLVGVPVEPEDGLDDRVPLGLAVPGDADTGASLRREERGLLRRLLSRVARGLRRAQRGLLARFLRRGDGGRLRRLGRVDRRLLRGVVRSLRWRLGRFLRRILGGLCAVGTRESESSSAFTAVHVSY